MPDIDRYPIGDPTKLESGQRGVVEIVGKRPSANSSNDSGSDTGKINVLNNYRSYTYKFTLAALRSDQVNDPNSYRSKELDLVIARTGGKDTVGLTEPTKLSEMQFNATQKSVYDKNDAKANRSRAASTLSSNQELVSGFNEKSPGRFDFFIDNVEITTLMGFVKEASTTIPQTIQFNVFEPYSINGFIEALHVSAIAAGYLNYAQASFVLKTEFIGYPDDQSVENSFPEKIKNSERYFVFKFSGLDIDVDEKGTRYKCRGIPFNEIGFGQSNILKKPVQASGSTVKKLLENFMENITKQVLEANKGAREGSDATKGDIYEIKFPTDINGTLNFNSENDIGKSKILEPTKENTIYKFVDNGTEQPNGYVRTPGKNTKAVQQNIVGVPPVVNFFNNAAIHESIAAVIRDSTYLRDKLKDIKKHIDIDEMFDYFLISVDVEDQKEIDQIAQTFYKKFTYIVTEYKVHYTKIPGYESQGASANKLKNRSVRQYDYIYSGKNIDVLNFKLNFNLLYFEAIPYALGNNQRPIAKDLSGTPKKVDAKIKVQSRPQDQIPIPKQQVVPYDVVPTDGKSGQLLNDPYATLAINLHEAIINSRTNMIVGEISIVGDPVYIATSSIAKYRPPVSGVLTNNGEVAHTSGEVFITINFRNPIDIDPLDKGGLLNFGDKAPFSGIYKVIRVHSTFNEGKFTQRLEIIRIPGQVDNDKKETDPGTKIYSQVSSESSGGTTST